MFFVLSSTLILFANLATAAALELENDLEGNIAALHVPTFAKDLTLKSFYTFVAFIIVQISLLAASLAPIDKIRPFEPSLISGTGAFYLVSHLSSIIPKIPIVAMWVLGIVCGSAAGFFSFKQPLVKSISLSISAGYILSYFFILYFAISKLLFFILTFAVFSTLLALLSFKLEKFHYPICRAVICTYMAIIFIENVSPFSLLQPLHGTGVPVFLGLRGSLTIFVFVLGTAVLFAYTLDERRVLGLLGIKLPKNNKDEGNNKDKDAGKK